MSTHFVGCWQGDTRHSRHPLPLSPPAPAGSPPGTCEPLAWLGAAQHRLSLQESSAAPVWGVV